LTVATPVVPDLSLLLGGPVAPLVSATILGSADTV